MTYYEKLSPLYVKIRPELRKKLNKKCKLEGKNLRRVVEEILERELSDVDKRKKAG